LCLYAGFFASAPIYNTTTFPGTEHHSLSGVETEHILLFEYFRLVWRISQEIIMTSDIQIKLDRLRDILRDTGGCAVAFSGGVDSSLLLTVAHEVLGDRALGVIATSSTYPEREFLRAHAFVRERGIPYVVISSEELDIPGYRENPANRCYFCKRELFEKVGEQARAHGLERVADGSNADDASDYRPGMNAARELGVLSPLRDAGLTKNEIRTLAREVYALEVADKPAMACLASRFPYGSLITREKLSQVERIEEYLEHQGLRVFRARHHGEVVRLELGPEEMRKIMEPELRGRIAAMAREQGFGYVTMDLEGYRTGSMNEGLKNLAP
jgi:pyridinium-3,5-biscarboxylic acid mononucleotide sulfurtransferase